MNEINTTTSLKGNEVPPTSTGDNATVKVLERRNAMIAGVAGGLADYFDFDATIVRLVLVALALLTFPAVPLAYLVAWIIIPKEGRSAVPGFPSPTSVA